MRTRSLLAPSLAAAALVVSGCSDGSEPAQPSATQPDDAAATSGSAVGVAEPPSTGGYLCRYVSPSAQQGVTGAAWEEPTQVTVQDDTTTWACEGRDGDEQLIRVAISRGAEPAAAEREAAHDAGVEQDGPAYLGEAYLAPRKVTALTLCTVRGGAAGDYEPYALVVEALADGESDLRRDLVPVAAAMARTLDQSVGCSPKLAADRAAEAAGAPAP